MVILVVFRTRQKAGQSLFEVGADVGVQAVRWRPGTQQRPRSSLAESGSGCSGMSLGVCLRFPAVVIRNTARLFFRGLALSADTLAHRRGTEKRNPARFSRVSRKDVPDFF